MVGEFKIGDFVLEKFPTHGYHIGTVINTYELDSETRCVVRFDDGVEGVHFDRELRRQIVRLNRVRPAV